MLINKSTFQNLVLKGTVGRFEENHCSHIERRPPCWLRTQGPRSEGSGEDCAGLCPCRTGPQEGRGHLCGSTERAHQARFLLSLVIGQAAGVGIG